MESIYRFRPTKALLDGYHELELQEIYFASLPELNDPLEGFKDLFWKGDVIVWKNLLRHYLLCFMPGAPFLARSLREKWEDWHSDTQHLEKNRKGASRLLGTDQSRANAKPFPDSISR